MTKTETKSIFKIHCKIVIANFFELILGLMHFIMFDEIVKWVEIFSEGAF